MYGILFPSIVHGKTLNIIVLRVLRLAATACGKGAPATRTAPIITLPAMSGGDCPAGGAPVADRLARAGPGLAAGGPAEATRAERRGARDGDGLEDLPLSSPPITIGACLVPAPVAAAGCARREGVCRARGGPPRPGGPDRRGGPARDGVPLLLLSRTMGVCLVPVPLAVAG